MKNKYKKIIKVVSLLYLLFLHLSAYGFFYTIANYLNNIKKNFYIKKKKIPRWKNTLNKTNIDPITNTYNICKSCEKPDPSVGKSPGAVLCVQCELVAKDFANTSSNKKETAQNVKSFECMFCKEICFPDDINYHPKFSPYYQCIKCFNKKQEESSLNLNNISFNTSSNNNQTPRQNLYFYAYNNYKYSKMNFSKNFEAFKKYQNNCQSTNF